MPSIQRWKVATNLCEIHQAEEPDDGVMRRDTIGQPEALAEPRELFLDPKFDLFRHGSLGIASSSQMPQLYRITLNDSNCE